MKLTIAAVGVLRNRELSSLYEHYISRVPWSVMLHEIKSIQNCSVSERHNFEEKIITKKLIRCSIFIVLDETGKQLSSGVFANKLKKWQEEKINLGFAIGGADGTSKALRGKATHVLSFGAMTWPHLLVRVMLAEQLYRASTIITRHPYHRA